MSKASRRFAILRTVLYRRLIRPCLFSADPEKAHERALKLATTLGRWRIARRAIAGHFTVTDPRLSQKIFGLEFPNAVGLAAGYDKNAVGLEFWPSLGFGFVEIGSVTARPQAGNPRPRLFRLAEQEALINRMGFNNDGADVIAPRVPVVRPIPVGVNVGKDRDVDLAGAGENYAQTMAKFAGRADFFVVNVSSPNTPGLRQLQGREKLDALLAQLPVHMPVLVKVAPDLAFDQIDDVLASAQKHKLAGIVATNTTINHPTPPEGGLSGTPLRARATECIRHIHRQSKLPVIGVGGIFTAEDAYEKIRAGASLVEIWTSLVYQGPAIVRKINCGLLRLLERDGFGSVAQAVGTE